jgi:hypothetical protein
MAARNVKIIALTRTANSPVAMQYQSASQYMQSSFAVVKLVVMPIQILIHYILNNL